MIRKYSHVKVLSVLVIITMALSGCSSISRISGQDGAEPLTPQRELQMARETHIALIETAITLHEGGIITDKQVSSIYTYSKVAKSVIDRWDSLIAKGDNTESVKQEYALVIDKMKGVMYGHSDNSSSD